LRPTLDVSPIADEGHPESCRRRGQVDMTFANYVNISWLSYSTLNSRSRLSSSHHLINKVMSKNEKRSIEYQREPEHLVPAIFERGFITPWELLKIVTWKSAKGVAWLSLNTEDEIVSCTKETVAGLKSWSGPSDLLNSEMTEEYWDIWEAKAGELIGADKAHAESGIPSGLLRLHGVGYPVATAVLGLLMPKVFPVMDKWAVETIFGSGASKKRWQTKAKYREYTQLLVKPTQEELQKFHTLRDRDKAAMNISMRGGNILQYVSEQPN